jgi:hypothetical protein
VDPVIKDVHASREGGMKSEPSMGGGLHALRSRTGVISVQDTVGAGCKVFASRSSRMLMISSSLSGLRPSQDSQRERAPEV